MTSDTPFERGHPVLIDAAVGQRPRPWRIYTWQRHEPGPDYDPGAPVVDLD